jgi:hypothetical protein
MLNISTEPVKTNQNAVGVARSDVQMPTLAATTTDVASTATYATSGTTIFGVAKARATLANAVLPPGRLRQMATRTPTQMSVASSRLFIYFDWFGQRRDPCCWSHQCATRGADKGGARANGRQAWLDDAVRVRQIGTDGKGRFDRRGAGGCRTWLRRCGPEQTFGANSRRRVGRAAPLQVPTSGVAGLARGARPVRVGDALGGRVDRGQRPRRDRAAGGAAAGAGAGSGDANGELLTSGAAPGQVAHSPRTRARV